MTGAASALLAPRGAFAAPGGESLGALAAAKGILFGASLAAHELDRDYGAKYAEIYQRDCRIVTSELEFKLSALRAKEDAIDFYDADRLVQFAHGHGMQIRAHTLIWNDDVPQWIKDLDGAGAAQLLDMHIETVMVRYKDSVRFWDVVNEPIGPWDNLPGKLRAGPFYAALGEGYITAAFNKARSIEPSAVLVLNEAQCETADDNGEIFRSSFLALLKRLKDAGAAIDAVGLQGHLKTAARYDFPRFTAFLQDIAALGFAIHITELDVNDTGADGSITDRDRQVAALYGKFLGAVLSVKAVNVVQTWQLSDAASWMQDKGLQADNKMHTDPRPLPYDSRFRRKLAWDAIAQAFANAPPR